MSRWSKLTPEQREARKLYQREYKKRRYDTDPEFRERVKKRNREAARARKGDLTPEQRELKMLRKNKSLRQRYATDPEYRKKRLENNARWHKENGDVIRKRRRVAYAHDPKYREAVRRATAAYGVRKRLHRNAEALARYWKLQALIEGLYDEQMELDQ